MMRESTGWILDVLSDAGINWSDIDVLSDSGINWNDIGVSLSDAGDQLDQCDIDVLSRCGNQLDGYRCIK